MLGEEDTSTSKQITIIFTLSWETWISNCCIHTTDERRSRQIHSSNRTITKKVLSLTPSCLYNKKVSSLMLAELGSGKRNRVGSSQHVLRKISSEGQKDQLLHLNLITSLKILNKDITESFGCKKKPFMDTFNRLWQNHSVFSIFIEEGSKNIPQFCQRASFILGCNRCSYKFKGYILTMSQTDHCTTLLMLDIQKRLATCWCGRVYFNRAFCNSHLPFSWRLPSIWNDVTWASNIIVPKYIVIDRNLVLLLSFLRVLTWDIIRLLTVLLFLCAKIG